MPEQFRIPKKRATPRRGAGFGMEAASFRGRWVTYNRVKAGTLPHARVGRKLLFSRQKLYQWIALGGDLAGTMVGFFARMHQKVRSRNDMIQTD